MEASAPFWYVRRQDEASSRRLMTSDLIAMKTDDCLAM